MRTFCMCTIEHRWSVKLPISNGRCICTSAMSTNALALSASLLNSGESGVVNNFLIVSLIASLPDVGSAAITTRVGYVRSVLAVTCLLHWRTTYA